MSFFHINFQIIAQNFNRDENNVEKLCCCGNPPSDVSYISCRVIDFCDRREDEQDDRTECSSTTLSVAHGQRLYSGSCS